MLNRKYLKNGSPVLLKISHNSLRGVLGQVFFLLFPKIEKQANSGCLKSGKIRKSQVWGSKVWSGFFLFLKKSGKVRILDPWVRKSQNFVLIPTNCSCFPLWKPIHARKFISLRKLRKSHLRKSGFPLFWSFHFWFR